MSRIRITALAAIGLTMAGTQASPVHSPAAIDPRPNSSLLAAVARPAADATGPGWGVVACAGLLGTAAGVVIGFAAARSRARSTTQPPAPRSRSWDKPAPETPTQPTDPDVDPPAPEAEEAAPPPPPSPSARKRAWEK